MIVGLIREDRGGFYKCHFCDEQGFAKYWVRVNDPVVSQKSATVPCCEACAKWYDMRKITANKISQLRNHGFSPSLITSTLQLKSVANLVAIEEELQKEMNEPEVLAQ